MIDRFEPLELLSSHIWHLRLASVYAILALGLLSKGKDSFLEDCYFTWKLQKWASLTCVCSPQFYGTVTIKRKFLVDSLICPYFQIQIYGKVWSSVCTHVIRCSAAMRKSFKSDSVWLRLDLECQHFWSVSSWLKAVLEETCHQSTSRSGLGLVKHWLKEIRANNACC